MFLHNYKLKRIIIKKLRRSDDMEWMSQGINAPKGFYCAATHCGIKRKRKDITMIVSEMPCTYAGVFTKNIVKAAPVTWNQQRLEANDLIKGIIINSGNANACTGTQGYNDTVSMANYFSHELGITKEEILVSSTGVIGVGLPMDKISNGIKEVVKLKSKTIESAKEAAEGIMTTDTFTKSKTVKIIIEGKEVIIAGMSKGSGMIHPNMGTMLSFVTTDATIDAKLLNKLLKEVINDTYNMISVDGDTSTNDMVLVLANGESGTSSLVENSKNYEIFKKAFYQLNEELAILIVRDGEGATKFIEVEVIKMTTKIEARKMVHAIITSNLVKTAFFGEDANWGRILCALGYSGAIFDPNKVKVEYISNSGKIILLENGQQVMFDEEFALAILKETDIKVLVTCYQGNEGSKGWGCDLSYDYVKINGEYRT